ncbi:alpha/beta fold hydrolase [Rhodococcus sp. NPDC003348]
MSALSRSHVADAPLVTSRRGQFWIPGETVTVPFGTVQRGPMYVAWESPEKVTRPHPVVLVHGGGGQGTDWLGTVDGKPGWAAHFVAAGYTTYVVDRPGHGRSPFHPDIVGRMGPAAPYEVALSLFAPPERADTQTQWPFGREAGSLELDQLVASGGPLPADLADSQDMDASRLVKLLELIGPSVLVTHSAGAPAGWLVTDRAPELVVGIAAVEPLGPAFVDFPGIGSLDWGLTAAPVSYEAGFTTPAEVQAADASELAIAAFTDKPVAVFAGTASVFRDSAPVIVEHLNATGAKGHYIDLGELGIVGNGHGLIFEANAAETVVPVIDWIGSLEQ